jgi:hypothetical protein
MILFELMEGELPYESASSGNISTLIIDVKAGNVKPLKSAGPPQSRSPELISLYNSMRNLV